jgi:signal transduction histidine kinase
MRFGRLRAVTRTLRFRLTAWNTAAVLVMVAVALFAVREGLRRVLWHEFDQILLEDTAEIGLAVREFGTHLEPLYEELERKAKGHAQHGWFVQMLDGQGKVLWASRGAPALELPAGAAPTPAVLQIGPHRLAQTLLPRPGGAPLVVRVGASTELLEGDLALVTRIMLLAGGLIAVCAPLVGYWLSGRATEPLAHIIRTTARLRPENLGERLRLRRSGDELDQLSETINGMLDRIAAYLQQRRDFLANAAHELRSPLAAVITAAEVALTAERSRAEHVELLGDILGECGSLELLVNQLLLLAEGDAGQLGLRKAGAPLDVVVRKALEMFEGVAESQGVELKAGPLAALRVCGDEYHLRQVVNNLVDNAIKFNRAGGRVLVEVEADGAAGARLRVADTGSGIPAEALPRVFERFYRGDKARQREPARRGTGLGLSICQAIVTALGGRIEVQSEPGAGSTFTVHLPLHAEGPV